MKNSRARKGFIGLCAATLVAGAPVITMPRADASPTGYRAAERTSDGVTADVLPTTQIDGVALDQGIAQGRVYVGGDFANARPAGAAAGTNLTPRANLLAYDLATGELVQSFQADTNAKVNAVAVSPDQKTVYVGGQFTSVGGQARYRLAAFDAATGALLNTWQPDVDASVYSIVATNDVVYVGGGFSKAKGQSRQRLAAFDAHTGALLAWAPTANNIVRAMTLSSDQSRVVIGGLFDTVNGSTATGTASLDATTGTLYSFALNRVLRNHGTNAGIYSLKTDGTKIIGTAFNYGLAYYEGVFMADSTSGSVTWLANCMGDSYDATAMGSTVYSVSHHHDCAAIGGFPATTPDTYRHAQSFTYQTTGTVGTGLPNYYGYPAPSMKAWQPDVAAGSYTGQYQGAWTIESNSDYVVMGGEFPSIDGVKQQGLARFAKPGIAPSKEGPVGASEMTPTATVSGQTVRLSWKAAYDHDNMGLTYRVLRNGQQVATTSADSEWWVRPTLTASESSVPGGTWQYTVQAVDPDGNVVTSSPVTVTVTGPNTQPTTTPTATPTGTPTATPTDTPTGNPTTNPKAPTNYAALVKAANPTYYWRMDEATGTPLVDQIAGNSMDTWNVTRRTAGVAGTSPSVTFTGLTTGNGSAGAARRLSSNGSAITQELWFRTTTSKGGVLMDQSETDRVGYSDFDDLNLYMTNDGRIASSVRSSLWLQSPHVAIASAPGLNDGQWHHAAVTLSSGGLRLYVDGKQVASNASVTRPVQSQGYWRVGGDATTYLTSEPTSGYFAGAIDEVAVYRSELPAATIAAHGSVQPLG